MAEALRGTTFQEFQMNKWLGKFWNHGRFTIVMIGARKSIGSPLLDNIRGNTQGGSKMRVTVQAQAGSRPRDSMRSNEFFKDDVDVGERPVIEVRSYIVPALSDSTGYKNEGYFRKVLTLTRKANLVIYCVDMSGTRLRGSVLRTLQKLKPDWSRTVVVLTFADALPALVRHRDDPDFHKSQYFNKKLAEWAGELKAMLERMGVQQEVIAKIDVCPIADEPDDLLPNGEPWLPALSLAIMDILSPLKKAAFLEEHPMLLPTVTVAAQQLATLSTTLDAARSELPVTGAGTRESMMLSPTTTAVAEHPTWHLREISEVLSVSESSLRATSVSSVLLESHSKSIKDALSKLRKDCPVLGILVIGRTGVGKSTLVNNLLGKEVASVGHTLQSETPEVNQHEDTVEGVPIIVYDTPGLGDVKGEADEQKHLDIIKDFLASGNINLVVYCFQMNETLMTSSLVGTFRKYHQIGVDWERSVIALTFADAVYVSTREQKCPSFEKSQYFEERLIYWQRELRRELSDAVEQQRTYNCPCFPRIERDTVGVESDVVERLKIFPTSLLPTDPLPNGKPWYVPLWLHIVEILSPSATVRFVDTHRKNICDEQAPSLSQATISEVKLSEEDWSRFLRNFASILEQTGIDSNQFYHAVARMNSSEVNSESSVRAFLKLLTTEQAVVGQSASKPHQECETILHMQLKSYGDRFVKDVESKTNPAFVAKLCRHEVIPESLKNQIAAAADGDTANELLFRHLCKQATCESLSKLLAAMTEAKGHPAMNRLGREMQTKLELSTPSADTERHGTETIPMETAV